MALIAGAYQTISVEDTVVSINPDLLVPLEGTTFYRKKSWEALLSVETDKIYFTLDGTDPDTATGVGHILNAGDYQILREPTDLINLKMIKHTGNAKAKITIWYRV